MCGKYVENANRMIKRVMRLKKQRGTLDVWRNSLEKKDCTCRDQTCGENGWTIKKRQSPGEKKGQDSGGK